MRPLLAFLVAVGVACSLHAASPAEVDRLLRDALGTPAAGFLGHYAAATPADPGRYESPADAARRIVASAPATSAQAADVTALQFDRLATALLASSSDDDRIAGYRARFHARRLIAAVRYNLFMRSLRLAELVAATYAEKDAVLAWRALVAIAASAQHPSAAALRADLNHYEASLKDLEEQCCPPDEAVLKEKIWQPASRL